MSRIIIHRHNDSTDLIARLLACIPAATFELETLCKLAGIKASREIPTAAVECVYRPRLLINPDFAAKYCVTDEHLFLLVMHELWHIILAHTRLYPRATMAHNIAFDAIINAGLARQFTRPEFRGFFEVINQADEFPGCLLRPPEGWPTAPVYRDDLGPPGTRSIIERLYPPMLLHRWSTPLYQEILDLLAEWIKDKIAKGEAIVVPTLLGDHSAEGDAQAAEDGFMKEVLRRVVRNWPPPPFAQPGKRGEGFDLNDWVMSISDSSEAARRAFARVLRFCLGPRYGKEKRVARTLTPGIGGMYVLPNSRDRTASARERLGVKGLLWISPTLIRARVPETPARTHVYLDVSGSMNQILPPLLNLLLPYAANGRAQIYQFSNKVEPLTLDQLKAGKLKSTQGTDINAVLAHITMQRLVRRVLIVTDGYVGKPAHDVKARLEERGIRLYAVIPSETNYKQDLEELTQLIIVLPPLFNRQPSR